MTDLTLSWHVRGRRASDFAVIEFEHQDEATAYKEARRLYGNGYQVTVWRVVREQIAERHLYGNGSQVTMSRVVREQIADWMPE